VAAAPSTPMTDEQRQIIVDLLHRNPQDVQAQIVLNRLMENGRNIPVAAEQTEPVAGTSAGTSAAPTAAADPPTQKEKEIEVLKEDVSLKILKEDCGLVIKKEIVTLDDVPPAINNQEQFIANNIIMSSSSAGANMRKSSNKQDAPATVQQLHNIEVTLNKKIEKEIGNVHGKLYSHFDKMLAQSSPGNLCARMEKITEQFQTDMSKVVDHEQGLVASMDRFFNMYQTELNATKANFERCAETVNNCANKIVSLETGAANCAETVNNCANKIVSLETGAANAKKIERLHYGTIKQLSNKVKDLTENKEIPAAAPVKKKISSSSKIPVSGQVTRSASKASSAKTKPIVPTTSKGKPGTKSNPEVAATVSQTKAAVKQFVTPAVPVKKTSAIPVAVVKSNAPLNKICPDTTNMEIEQPAVNNQPIPGIHNYAMLPSPPMPAIDGLQLSSADPFLNAGDQNMV